MWAILGPFALVQSAGTCRQGQGEKALDGVDVVDVV
jgi:hypothetical protein